MCAGHAGGLQDLERFLYPALPFLSRNPYSLLEFRDLGNTYFMEERHRLFSEVLNNVCKGRPCGFLSGCERYLRFLMLPRLHVGRHWYRSGILQQPVTAATRTHQLLALRPASGHRYEVPIRQAECNSRGMRHAFRRSLSSDKDSPSSSFQDIVF